MITASNAKMSRAGPSLGPNVVRMPRKTPAIATVPSAIAIAMAKTWRLSIPTSRAAVGSSAVARSARPSGVRSSSSWRPTSIADGDDQREQRQPADRELRR